MDLDTFLLESPLLRIVFIILAAGILLRLIFFFLSIFMGRKDNIPKWKYVLTSLGRYLLPLHKALLKKPVYILSRWFFHICLILVPVALEGHIIMVESSSLELSWPAIPGKLADILTIAYIVLGVFFLVRRVVLPGIRRKSTSFDYIFIFICILPFLSGYFTAHGTLDSISFFSDNILYIHIITSIIMILATVFLFVRSRLDILTCTGCAACELSCPTGTLESTDNEKQRVFQYAHYRCITCGSCIYACPEDAAELRHEFGFLNFFRVLKRQVIRAVDLHICARCGAAFAPEPQVDKVGRTLKASEDDLTYCHKCKKVKAGDHFRRMSPWTKKTA